MPDLVDRTAILDILENWMRTVKRSMYAGLMKSTILDTLGHVVDDIKAMKNINPEQVISTIRSTSTGTARCRFWRTPEPGK